MEELKTIVNNYNFEDTKTKLQSSNSVKGLLQIIENMEERFKESQIAPVLITLNHDPHTTLKGEAWGSIEEDRVKLLDCLLEDETIVYALSSIEVHSGSTKVLSKNDRISLEKIIDTSINVTQDIKPTTKATRPDKSKSVKKTRTKVIEKIIKDGKDALTKVSPSATISAIHSTIISYYTDRSTNKSWNSKSQGDKIRLILSFYELIDGPSSMLKLWSCLFRADVLYITINEDYNKAIEAYKFLPDSILTLEGYPHIHIAIGLISKDGEYTHENTIYNKLSQLYVMDDIKVDKKKSKNRYLGSISYVLKNERYKGVKEALLKVTPQGVPIVRGYVRLNSLVEPLKGLSVKELKNGDERKLVEMDLRYVRSEIKAMATETSYERLVSYIISKMKEGEYVICEGHIYRKRKGSKMSFEEYMTLEDFYENITNNSKHQRIANKSKGGILSRMRSKERKIEGIKECQGIKLTFPKIELDTSNVWIECKDFFYNTLTGAIVLENDKYYCYYYCDWLTLEDLKARIHVHEVNGVWTKILLNSNLELSETCSEIYRLIVLPQIPKGGVWHASGSSNSGKTSLLKPFISIFPPHQIGTIKSNIGRFDLFSVKDKAIIQLEEIDPYSLEREDGLKLLGREPVKVEEKHGSSSRAVVRGRQIYTSNVNIDDRLSEGFGRTLEEVKAYDNRIVNMKFDVIREVLVEATTEILNETALTVIMCGYHYFNRKYHNNDEDDIFEVLSIAKSTAEIEDEIRTELDFYEGYYKGTSAIPKSQLEYKDWIEENKIQFLE